MSEPAIPFVPEPPRTPSSIGRLTVKLVDDPASGYEAYFDARVVMDDGAVRTRRGNLVPHLTPTQRQGLIDFMADLRSQAEQEIL